ncbi:hypothetical protein EJ03DRAFT_336495 [Teratosphaeria nubilosa]|uniref:Uncharacterized protein n=1 Tax=Teratosphaeria nubilosa TaxID=161662 RepID=A0A6G1L8H6_9PEZI|nr:hypothetical protein EJ03DRAFT_336495 [Teratosphaeria nubilosa]
MRPSEKVELLPNGTLLGSRSLLPSSVFHFNTNQCFTELRDIIFHYVLGDDVGKVMNVAYGHVELQLDIDCALAYTCMSLRREFTAHVYRRLSNSLRLANQTMIIYPFKADAWAATLAHGLCTSSSVTHAVHFGVHTASQKADGAATHIMVDDNKSQTAVSF